MTVDDLNIVNKKKERICLFVCFVELIIFSNVICI